FERGGAVSVMPEWVWGPEKQRRGVEAPGRASVAAEQQVAVSGGVGLQATLLSPQLTAIGASFVPFEPLPDALRRDALQQVDKQLVAAKLLDKVGGNVSADAQKKNSFEAKF